MHLVNGTIQCCLKNSVFKECSDKITICELREAIFIEGILYDINFLLHWCHYPQRLVLLQDSATSYRHSKHLKEWLFFLEQTQSYYLWDLEFGVSGKMKCFFDHLIDRFAYFQQICEHIQIKQISIQDLYGFVFDRFIFHLQDTWLFRSHEAWLLSVLFRSSVNLCFLKELKRIVSREIHSSVCLDQFGII